MSARAVVIHGELHLTLATVAECFAVERAWVEEVYALGLLGPGERVDGSIAVAAALLDRVAEVLQLSRYHGVDLLSVAVFLQD